MTSWSFFSCGHHACTQYSSFSLTKALYSFVISFLSFHFIFLFIMPRIWFALFAAIVHCSDVFPLLCTIIPKSRFCSTLLENCEIVWVFFRYSSSKSYKYSDRLRKYVKVTDNINKNVSHESNFSRCLCRNRVKYRFLFLVFSQDESQQWFDQRNITNWSIYDFLIYFWNILPGSWILGELETTKRSNRQNTPWFLQC